MSLSVKDLEAAIEVNGAQVNNLQFADNIGLLTRSEPELQDITTQIEQTSRKFGLMIISKKPK